MKKIIIKYLEKRIEELSDVDSKYDRAIDELQELLDRLKNLKL